MSVNKKPNVSTHPRTLKSILLSGFECASLFMLLGGFHLRLEGDNEPLLLWP